MAEKRRRGFAGMDPQKQREIASKGGKAAHAKGTAHEFTPEEAREAGRKGGRSSRRGAARQEEGRTEGEAAGHGAAMHTNGAVGTEAMTAPGMP